MERAIPILPADSIAVAKDFYAAKLGFNVLFEASEDGVTGLIGLGRGTIQRRSTWSTRSATRSSSWGR